MNWPIAIANMPGPQFLLLYIIVIVLTLGGCWLLIRFYDPTSKLPVPRVPGKPNPHQIGYLRGGEKEVLKLVIFDLIERGYLKIKETKKWLSSVKQIAQEDSPPGERHLSSLERYIFNYYIIPRDASDIFQSIPSGIQDYCEKCQQKFEKAGMMPSSKYSIVGLTAGLVGASIILGLGGYKLAAALEKGKSNVGGLIMLGICSVLILVSICKQPRITQLGRRYLDQLQLAFEGLKHLDSASQTGTTQLLRMGIFGVAVLAGTEYESFSKMFQNTSLSGGGCGSGCSSGCGGGGCGGGCGGCGG